MIIIIHMNLDQVMDMAEYHATLTPKGWVMPAWVATLFSVVQPTKE